MNRIYTILLFLFSLSCSTSLFSCNFAGNANKVIEIENIDSSKFFSQPYGSYRTDTLVDGFVSDISKDKVLARKIELAKSGKVQMADSVIYVIKTVNGKTAKFQYFFEYLIECDTCATPISKLGSVSMATDNVNKLGIKPGVFNEKDLRQFVKELMNEYPGSKLDTIEVQKPYAGNGYQILKGNIAITVGLFKGNISIVYRDLLFINKMVENVLKTRVEPKIEFGE